MTDEASKSARRYDLDWLRVIAVCFLVMIHTAAMFDPYPVTAVKGHRSFPLILFATFLHEWRLAVLFIVSGAGSYFVLGVLTGWQFSLMRFKRIIIPLIVGTLVVVPVQLYYFQFLGNPHYSKSYFQFYVTIMWRFFLQGAFGRGRESLHWGHLWFLAYLFVCSLVALPLFLYLRRGSGRHILPRMAAFFEKRFAIFLFALPLVFVEIAMAPMKSGGRLIIIDDMANFLFYLVLFVYGFVIVSDDRFRAIIERHRWSALASGLVTSAVYLLVTFAGHLPVRGYNLNWTLFTILRGFNAWFWCVTVFGFGSRHLNFNHRRLPYANQAVYPVYILHLPLATMIAYHVVRWPVPVAIQFIVITLSAIAIAVCIFEFILRRTKVTRFLFGLKEKRLDQTAQIPPTIEIIPSTEGDVKSAPV